MRVHARLRVAAITLDFGNTLVRVDQQGLRAVVDQTADTLSARGIVLDRPAFQAAWAEERERQWREDVPAFREPDLEIRAVRVLARLRGLEPPSSDEPWDDAAAKPLVDEGEVAEVIEAYGGAFVRRMDPVADASSTLARLAGDGYAVAILSNWPLAVTIDRFAEAHGWLPYLRAIVVSQRIGWIKPHVAIYRAAEAALGLDEAAAASILHVGDDWAADVVGASRAGWRTAYLRDRQRDTPLPTSSRGDGDAEAAAIQADLEIDELAELPDRIELATESVER